MQSGERLARIERATDLPLLVLAIALIPLLVVPEVVELSENISRAMLAADWFIWAVFAVDLGIKVAVAPRRLSYIRSHWLQVAMVVLPFMRPLRAFRLVRLARLAAAGGFNVTVAQQLAKQKGTRIVVGAVLAILVMGATLVLWLEHDAAESNIQDFGDAVWWAVTTMTTVGYGDRYPVTAAGRGVAAALMVFGIAAMSVLTATIAAFLVREREESELARMAGSLQTLTQEVVLLRSQLDERTAR